MRKIRCGHHSHRETYPARKPGCEVSLPDSEPGFPYQKIATGTVPCHLVPRSGCIERLRDEACKLGAHAVWGVREGGGNLTAQFSRFMVEEPEARTAEKSKKPAERIQPVPGGIPSAETSSAPKSTQDRLRELDSLREKNLITEEEYKQGRSAILKSL